MPVLYGFEPWYFYIFNLLLTTIKWYSELPYSDPLGRHCAYGHVSKSPP